MDTLVGSPKAARTQGREAPLWYDWEACLGTTDLFRELSRKQLKPIADLALARVCYGGKVIVRAGSSSDAGALYAIVEGRVRVRTASGHERVLEAGESFGELGLLDGAPRSATVTADGSTRLACIKGPAFRRLLRAQPGIAAAVLRSLVATLRDIRADLGTGATDAGSLAHAQSRCDEWGEDWSLSTDEAVRLLAAVPLFQALPKKHLRTIARRVQLHSYPEGTTVVQQGATRAWFFHVIVKGSVRLTSLVGTDLLGPGDYFGELALIDGAPRAADVVAESPLTTLQISSTPFGQLLEEEPAVTLGLIQGVVRMIRDLQRASVG